MKTFTKINKSSRKQVLSAYTLLGHVKKMIKTAAHPSHI